MVASGDLQKKPGRRRRLLSGAAVVAGLALMVWGTVLLGRHLTAPPVYRYALGDAIAPAELAALGEQQVTVRRASVRSGEPDTLLAELEVAETPTGPVLLQWQSRVDDPFLTLTVAPDDVAALAAVLRRHVPADASVLAWWDSSRQFQLLGGVKVAFDQHLGTPLFVPAHWSARRSGIDAVERAFWRGGGADLAPQQARFQRFADALLAPEDEGIAALQALAGGKTTVLVLHLRDLILLGQLAPKKMGVAFQDFGAMGDVHGMVRRVHGWLDQHKYPIYGALQGKDRPLRAIALTDAPSGKTLAARLLPLMGNDQHDVAGATLVYRVGGFSVFEIAPAQATAALAGESRSR
jgi:hydroxylamine oxidation protein HaoB